MTTHKIKQMCKVEEEKIRTHSSFEDICLRERYDNRECCQSWSLGNYIAFLSNKDNCSLITDADVDNDTIITLHSNLTVILMMYSTHQYPSSRCNYVPPKCFHLNAVYNILHYISDINFLHPIKGNTKPFLSKAITFLPIAGSSSTVELFESMESWVSSLDIVKIVGVHFGIKYTLFNHYLLSDTIWLVAAGCVIFLVIWLYSASLFITIMTFLMMFWSLEVAYFLYILVFEIHFFPYINLVTVIIVIAIGADDVFIYCKVWQSAKSEANNGTLDKVVSDTLKHATLSMFVTSFTTAAALYTNFISSITAIRCFSVYAGTTVLCNFIFVVTWLPASIVVYDKWCNCEMTYNPEFSLDKNICYYFCKIPYKVYHQISDWSKTLFEKYLPMIIIRLRFVWLILFGGLGLGGIIVIFYHPKLKLPTSEKFQVFSSDHLLEQYDFVLNEQFWFERSHRQHSSLLPITIVWGVHPVDNGNKLNPTDRGTVEFDSSFDVTTINAQYWLMEFCNKLRNTKFYQQLPGIEWTNCFFENFQSYMQRPCSEYDTKCCNSSYKTLIQPKFECLQLYIPVLRNTPGVYYNVYSPGPRFDQKVIRAFIVEFLSKQKMSYSLESMKSFYESLDSWIKTEMSDAPPEMRNGWFVSDLSFLDLQWRLSQETPLTLGISILVVAIVSFLTTLNVFLSLFAIISISFVMFVTIGCLVLLGWQLNILESVIVTVAVGMSVDYTLHYGVLYRLSPELDRTTKVLASVSCYSNVITMAAITTFLAGAMMMPSTILVYKKFGIFLMLIISISWAYSTFFFQSLLCIFGPQGGFGQFRWPASNCCTSSAHSHVDKTVYTFSESTVSTTSSNPHTTSSSECRELEPLTHESHPIRVQHKHLQRSRYPRTNKTDSPELEPRRGSHVRFSISSVEKTGPDCACSEGIKYLNPRNDSVIEQEETASAEQECASNIVRISVNS
ncbi:hypothetical protein KUTeg_014859 [Tegillarca granosa]|uniref:SSD domain-containing protein n=1 Tax=Tegillarca granosa TaxID=220873 RepID=A0ABQ9EQU4_TEGGR|nr:hypothetical protein KUTeg_014859 [Tegillarca granosa]